MMRLSSFIVNASLVILNTACCYKVSNGFVIPLERKTLFESGRESTRTFQSSFVGTPIEHHDLVVVPDNLDVNTASTEQLNKEQSSSLNNPSQFSSNIGVPKVLRALKLGETLSLPSTPVEITRIATTPDIFHLRNFLPYSNDRKYLMDQALDKLSYAETKSGQVLHRTKSWVAWLDDDDDEQNGSNTTSSSVRKNDITSFMTNFCYSMFLDLDNDDDIFRHAPSSEDGGTTVETENVQVARYTEGGKFDLHHDGFNRVVTALTYLNGVAGTWFPFAKLAGESHHSEDEDDEPPVMTMEGVGMTVGKTPGKDGIWVVGDEFYVNNDYAQSVDDCCSDNPHVIRIAAGDAVVFYNYEHNEKYGGTIMDWRSLHAGMPATREKWIATNWIRVSDDVV